MWLTPTSFLFSPHELHLVFYGGERFCFNIIGLILPPGAVEYANYTNSDGSIHLHTRSHLLATFKDGILVDV